MQAPYIVARLIGPLFGTIGVGMLTNTDTYRQIGQQFLATPAIIYLSGTVVLLIGLIILNVHSAWTRDWRTTITVVGWFLTVMGIWRIIAPQFIPFVAGAILANHGFFTGLGIVLISLGAFLTYKGYVSAAFELETQHE